MSRTLINPSLISGANSFLGIGKNKVFNGDMMLDQANGGNVVTLAPSANVKYGCDMLWNYSSPSNPTGTYTAQRQATSPPTGFLFYQHYACTVADASAVAAYSDYNIENGVVRDFLGGTANARPINVSFWIRNSQTGTFGLHLYNGANGGTTRYYESSYTVTAANTWQFVSIQIPGDTAISSTWNTGMTSLGLGLRFIWAFNSIGNTNLNQWVNLSSIHAPTGQVNNLSSTSNTWDLTGVQVELGTVATPFEYLPYGMQLALCQRYYEKSYAIDTAPGTDVHSINSSQQVTCVPSPSPNVYGSWIPFAVVKRIQPTVTFWTETGSQGQWTYNNSSGTGNNLTVTCAPRPQGFNPFESSDGTKVMGYGCWVADARF